MSDQKPAQGLVLAKSGTVLTTPDQYAEFIEKHRAARAHVLSPVTDIGSLPENWVFVPSAVQINPDENFGEVYRDGLFCKQNEVALTKVGLRKIAKAAGISWEVKREDSGTVPYYWAMKCTLSYRGHDGLPKSVEASYEWDLRDGSPRLQKSDGVMSSKELNRARLTGYRRCEAGAINAAIREYGLKQKYTKEELVRPFVVFNLVFKPETEEQKNMLAQAALTGTNLLYGGSAALPPATSHAKGDIVDQFTGEIVEDDKTPASNQERPFEDGPAETADKDTAAVVITGVTQTATGDYYVTTEGGQKLHTKDRGVAAACNEARKTKTPIRVEAERRGQEIEILEVGGGKY